MSWDIWSRSYDIDLHQNRHKNQIQALQVQDAGEDNELASFASLTKSAFGTLYVYLVFLICYFAMFICQITLCN